MRYVIIDYMHLAHRSKYAQPLSAKVNVNGMPTEIDTTIPNYTIKNIVRYSDLGANKVAVCFEGGETYRKAYFGGGSDKGDGYKGGRVGQNTDFYAGCDLTLRVLLAGGVSCYRKAGFEADDLVASLVASIKLTDTKTPIDVVTNDADLLPLVDEQVSVYKRASLEYYEQGCPRLAKYYQVTPRSYSAFLETTSDFKGFYMPYNTMLLNKMLRGDPSDNIQASVKGYGKVKFSALVQQMEADGVDFGQVFRYENDFDTVIAPILLNYFSEDDVMKMKFIFNGIRLQVNTDLTPMQILNVGKLQSAVLPLRINLVR